MLKKLPPLTHLLVVLGLLCSALLSLFSPAGRALAGENIWTWVSGISGAQFVISSVTDSTWIYLMAYNPDRLYRSSDGGATWVQAVLPPENWYRITAPVPYHSERLVAVTFASDGGMTTPNYISLDAGVTWHAMNVIAEEHLGFSYVDPNEMYSTDGTAFFTSADSGQTWVTTGAIPAACKCVYDGSNPGCGSQQPVSEIQAAPSAPNVIMLKMQSDEITHDSLCRSADHGATWQALPLPVTSTHDFMFDPKNFNTIYLGASGGGWKTTDGGVTWRPMANGLTEPWSFLIDPENTQNLFALNDNAVWESVDGGASWQKLDGGIPGLQVGSLAITRRSTLHLYVQVGPSGLWELDRTTAQTYSASINGGALFTKTPNVTLTLSAPAGTTQMQISNDGGFAGAAWEPFAGQKSWTITSVGETPMPRTVYVRYRTNGQVSGLYLDDIVLDREGPHGSFHIDDPLAGPTVAAQAPAGLERSSAVAYNLLLPFLTVRDIAGMRAVALQLTAVDEISGVDSMRIGAHADLADAQTLDFAASTEWYIPRNGSTTLYVSFVDRAGNESPIYAATTSTP